MSVQMKYKYRAWLLDVHGNPVQGIEEEYLCKTNNARRCAWNRAVRVLDPDGSQSVRVESIERAAG